MRMSAFVESNIYSRGQPAMSWLIRDNPDGTRIDLTVQSIDYALQHIQDDKLCKI